MKKSEIFKAAKDVLWDGVIDEGKKMYLCHCIEEIYFGDISTNMGYSDMVKCKALVIKAIDGYRCYENYLMDKIGRDSYNKMSHTEIQAGRLAILETLIKEAEANETLAEGSAQ